MREKRGREEKNLQKKIIRHKSVMNASDEKLVTIQKMIKKSTPLSTESLQGNGVGEGGGGGRGKRKIDKCHFMLKFFFEE